MKSYFENFIKKYLFIVLGVALAICAVFVSNYFQGNVQTKIDTKIDTYKETHQKNQQKHDFLLALSWSPTFCLEQDPQGKQPQCRIDLPKQYRFIVHGLWPQSVTSENYLNYCKPVEKKLEASLVKQYFYLMPSSSLMLHQWEKHASCGHFTQKSYFEKIENLYQTFKIDTLFQDMKQSKSLALKDIIQKITTHIPNLTQKNIVIACRKGHFAELRICLDNTYSPRHCHISEVKSGRCGGGQSIKIPL